VNGTFIERVDSLILVNALTSTAGWFEWGSRKKNIKILKQQGVNQVSQHHELEIKVINIL